MDKAHLCKMTLYVLGSGMSLARIEVDTVALTYTRTYFHPDQLGSATAGTSQSGAVLWREQYAPYGDKLTAPSANDDLGSFTGHIDDDATTDMNLTYMQARYYDPGAGRFTSIDPVGFLDTQDPRFFNRYSYTFNDPVNLTDPNGESPLKDVWDNVTQPPYERANLTGNNTVITRDESGTITGGGTVPVENLSQDTTEGIAMVGRGLAVSAGSVAPNVGAVSNPTLAASRSVRATNSTPTIAQPYSRPSNATTPAQRAAVQGKPCTDCGAVTSTQRANHTPPLVQEYYSTGTIDTTRMRSTGAVTPHCPTCSNAEGGRMSAFSKAMKKNHGLD